MRRVVCREFGPPERLVVEEAPDPRPGRGEVLIRVRAAGVGFVDGLIVAGLYQVKPPLPFTPGLVVAGEVAGSGGGVPGLPTGSRVVGCWMGLGGYATHRLVPAEAVVPLPEAVSFEVAATAVDSYTTILFALTRRTSVAPGEWVVVLGAGGGIGLAAVDVASSLGARVIGAASSRAKRAASVTAGAHATIDYQTEDLKARVREITGTGADLVVDPVGDRYAEPALRSLRPNGRYLVVGFAGGSIPRLPLNRILLGNRTVIGIDWGAWSGPESPATRRWSPSCSGAWRPHSSSRADPRPMPATAPAGRSANSADGGSPASWRSCPSALDEDRRLCTRPEMSSSDGGPLCHRAVSKRAREPIDGRFDARYCALKFWFLCDYGGLPCRTCLVTFSCACPRVSGQLVMGAAGG